MKSENTYIGDDKFKKFLEHYNCPTPLEVVKLRFAGAICSPNPELRPTDVIASFWENNQAPRLETKKEAELFFKFFMGLWDKMFELVSANSLVLPRVEPTADLIALCEERYALIQCDKMAVKSLNFLIEHYVLPHIDSLRRTVN